MNEIIFCMLVLGISMVFVFITLRSQRKEIDTLRRYLSDLQDSTITFSNNMNEYMKNQNDINQMLTDRIKRGY
jgi:hypothetical protein